MAKYDHGGGCACGLYKVCECKEKVVIDDDLYGNPELRKDFKSTKKVKSNGGSSKYYVLPEYAKELQDLIEYRNMNAAVSNIFKAAWRLGAKDGIDEFYDLNKVIWYAVREINRRRRLQDMSPIDFEEFRKIFSEGIT